MTYRFASEGVVVAARRALLRGSGWALSLLALLCRRRAFWNKETRFHIVNTGIHCHKGWNDVEEIFDRFGEGHGF